MKVFFNAYSIGHKDKSKSKLPKEFKFGPIYIWYLCGRLHCGDSQSGHGKGMCQLFGRSAQAYAKIPDVNWPKFQFFWQF